MSRFSEALKDELRRRADGRCEYCQRREKTKAFAFHIDHIRPLSHGGSSDVDNLAFACFRCNIMKGTNIATFDTDGSIVRLFNPRVDYWNEHFVLEESLGMIEALTPQGRATIQVLQLNDLSEVQDRYILLSEGKW